MADTKISDLSALAIADVDGSADVLVIVDTSEDATKKITYADLVDGFVKRDSFGNVDVRHSGTGEGLKLISTLNVSNAGSKVAFFGAGRDDDGEEMASIRGLFVSNSGGSGNQQLGHLQFNTSGVERVRIDDNGNIGIGTTSPSAELDVNGTAKADSFQIDSVTWSSGAGTPEGSVTAVVGSLFSRTDGGAGTSLYVKESGAGNTGWVAK